MRTITHLRPTKAWVVKLLPLVIMVSVILIKMSVGMADPDFPPIPPPGGG
jgi:hypothetical protein